MCVCGGGGGRREYNTHKYVSIHQLGYVIVGALERRHAHMHVYSTHIRTCVHTLKERASQTYQYLVSLSPKTYVCMYLKTKWPNTSQVDQLSPSVYSLRNNIKVQSKAASLVHASTMYYKIAIEKKRLQSDLQT